MNTENKSSTTPLSFQGKRLEIAQAQYDFSLNGTPMSWGTDTGKMQILGVDASIFWLAPSLSFMFAPILEEIGIDLFRLIVANSSSLGTQEDYESIKSQGDIFTEGFAVWTNLVVVASWGKFKFLEFDIDNTHTIIQINNPW